MKKIIIMIMVIISTSIFMGCKDKDVSSETPIIEDKTEANKEIDIYKYESDVANECKKIGEAVLVDWMIEPEGNFNIYLSGNYEVTKSKTESIVKYLSNLDYEKYKIQLVLISNYGVQQNPISIK